MKNFLFLLYCCLPGVLFAANGDTTYIRFQNKMDMTWYGNFDFKGKFPDGTKTYRQILMKYSLGCASTGCSGWDYTNHIQYLKALGIYDSSVAKIDTSGGKHDTLWNKTERTDKYELGRVITPYGTYMQGAGSNGYLPTWQHRYWFDVTDFVDLLKDSGTMRCVYSGYSSGFSATVEFYFIEGTPPRKVLKLENVWGSGGANCMGYSNSTQFESTQIPMKTLSVLPNTKGASFQFTSSGHGGDNSENAAEFYDESAEVLLNNNSIGKMHLWRDDCGKNPIYPQGGTWIYDRANWCPGTKVNTFSFDLAANQLHPGALDSIDVNYDPYTWTGNQTPCYAISSVFVQYGDYNFNNDAALTNIIAPSNDENYRRLNPVCYNPVIEIKNKGKNTMTSCVIKYGLSNGIKTSYTWTGSLLSNKTQEITLPNFNWTGALNGSVFEAEILKINNVTDEWALDNKATSIVAITPKHDANLIIWFKTNNRPTENRYKILDWSGVTVYEKNSMTALNTVYKDTVHLAVGCYTFVVVDDGGDGISWWANQSSAGTGYVYFKNISGSLQKNFNMDFGSEIRYNFTTAYTLGLNNNVSDEAGMSIYPNPSSKNITVQLNDIDENATLSVLDITGKSVYEVLLNHSETAVDIKNLSHGIYLVKVISNGRLYTEKVIIE
ncbi:MAG: peptide-N-glycosidase F-related protein [Bacteroidetes bacterium]|nr:peptide-N-glycosidase F-related protein [Bacteroidota bacterium]